MDGDTRYNTNKFGPELLLSESELQSIKPMASIVGSDMTFEEQTKYIAISNDCHNNNIINKIGK